MIICINGEFLADDKAKVSAFDRGFLYGDGVFETLHSYEGKVFEWSGHWRRLESSAQFIELKLDHSSEEIHGWVQELLQKNDLLRKEAAVRIEVTRGVSTLDYAAEPDRPTWVVFVKPVDRVEIETWQKGIRCGSVEASWLSPQLSHHKTINYLPTVMVSRIAKKNGWFEAFFVDDPGYVLEGARSNIFIVEKGTLKTPPLRGAVLAGITRQTVLQLAREAGIPVEETMIHRDQLFKADEVFMTSSIVEIAPILEFDGRKTGDSSHPAISSLQRAFRRRIQTI
ncbi:MAG: aminotransferase class IV [Deltaproteobacteria bacterium]|nr:aminotransferase class IV [Deltaproteobacteria bacterium]